MFSTQFVWLHCKQVLQQQKHLNETEKEVTLKDMEFSRSLLGTKLQGLPQKVE